jgi:hypothetical protein
VLELLQIKHPTGQANEHAVVWLLVKANPLLHCVQIGTVATDPVPVAVNAHVVKTNPVGTAFWLRAKKAIEEMTNNVANDFITIIEFLFF